MYKNTFGWKVAYEQSELSETVGGYNCKTRKGRGSTESAIA